VVVGAAGGENEPNIPDFFSSFAPVPVTVPVSLSPRLRERPPNEVSSAIEASLDISGAVVGGEAEGDDNPALKPKPVCPNTLVLELVNEPNALLVFPNALCIEEAPNVLPVLDPNPLDEPKALGAEENAPKPEVVWGGCPKEGGWDGWLKGVLNADSEDVCPNADDPNPVDPNPLLEPVPLPKLDCPNTDVETG
jgi:hypothetical protein